LENGKALMGTGFVISKDLDPDDPDSYLGQGRLRNLSMRPLHIPHPPIPQKTLNLPPSTRRDWPGKPLLP
jgi:hypothetical protein